MTARVLIPKFVGRPRLPKGTVLQHLSGQTMGTTWFVKLIASSSAHQQAIQRGVQRELDRLEAQMSTWRSTSALSIFNVAPAGSWCVLPEELLSVLDCAIRIARETEGAFDPTVGGLVNRWGFGPVARGPGVPSDLELADLRERMSWRRISIDVRRCSAFQPGGVYLDLSSIAKGFSVDHIAQYLGTLGIDSYLVEVGGELRGRGVKMDGTPWWVGLETAPLRHSDLETPSEPLIAALQDMAIATSGDYRRTFQDNGVYYSHIIDPRSGQPIQNNVATVTVLHADCMQADAYSTALMVLGVEEGLRLADPLGLAALLVCRTGKGLEEHMTPQFAAMLDTDHS